MWISRGFPLGCVFYCLLSAIATYVGFSREVGLVNLAWVSITESENSVCLRCVMLWLVCFVVSSVQWFLMLCYVMLCCAMATYAMLCYALMLCSGCLCWGECAKWIYDPFNTIQPLGHYWLAATSCLRQSSQKESIAHIFRFWSKIQDSFDLIQYSPLGHFIVNV